MTTNFISKLFNLFGLCHFSYALYYHFTVINPIDVKFRGFEFGGPFIYITILASVSVKTTKKTLNFWKIYFRNFFLICVDYSQGCSSDLLCCGVDVRRFFINWSSKVQRLSLFHFGTAAGIFNQFDVLGYGQHWSWVGVPESNGRILPSMVGLHVAHKCFDFYNFRHPCLPSSVSKKKGFNQRLGNFFALLPDFHLCCEDQHRQMGLWDYRCLNSTAKDRILRNLWARCS